MSTEGYSARRPNVALPRTPPPPLAQRFRGAVQAVPRLNYAVKPLGEMFFVTSLPGGKTVYQHKPFSESAEALPSMGSSPSPSTAGQTRVTPSQLIQALNHFDIAKELNDQRYVNTISMDEAIRELNLDISPEQLLAAVPKPQAGFKVRGQFGVNWLRKVRSRARWISAFMLGIGLLVGAVNVENIVDDYKAQRDATISYAQFTRLLQQHHVANVRFGYGYIEGHLSTNIPFTVRTSQDSITRDHIVRLLQQSHVEILEP